MKVYYPTKEEAISSGTVLELRKDLLPEKKDAQQYLFTEEFFADGLSEYGREHLLDFVYLSSQAVEFEDFEKSNDLLQRAFFEYSFELVRKMKYPHMPSRMQALHVFGGIAIPKEYKLYSRYIYELELEGEVHALDLGWAYGFLKFIQTSPFSFVQVFSPFKAWSFACNYWEGRKSDTPMQSMLVSLPAKVIQSRVVRWVK